MPKNNISTPNSTNNSIFGELISQDSSSKYSVRDYKTIIVSNIKKGTHSETISNVFDKFGPVYEVELNEDDSGNFNGKATVCFR